MESVALGDCPLGTSLLPVGVREKLALPRKVPSTLGVSVVGKCPRGTHLLPAEEKKTRDCQVKCLPKNKRETAT